MTAKLAPPAALTVVAGLCLVLAALAAPATAHAEDIVVEIEISPRTININADSTWVTVHTDIRYDDVDPSRVVNLFFQDHSIPMSWSTVDDRGLFVAKFAMDAFIDGLGPYLEIPAVNELGIDGWTVLDLDGDGVNDYFYGYGSAMVAEGGPRGGKGN